MGANNNKTSILYAELAQLVEQRTWVVSSKKDAKLEM